MLIKKSKRSDCIESEVTPEGVYQERRSLLKRLGFVGVSGLVGASGLLGSSASAGVFDLFDDDVTPFKTSTLKYLPSTDKPAIATPESKVTSYNNFYEFGTSKQDPIKHAQAFNVNPWQLSITGEVNKPLTLDYDQLFSTLTLEERIYRLRCVEAWSMVIPWVGFSLADLIKKADPTSQAKYVRFKTLHDPKQMRGQRSWRVGGGVDYPYEEGLRIDEAMHPLAFLAVGLYGKTLPPQNGAPIRLVVPWKYGFKSIKSIVSIELAKKQPATTWQKLAPQEYGFYANVNPAVDHPRWSQARERIITSGGVFDQKRKDTRLFNGYDEVAHLYKGMDLRRNY